MKKPISTAQTDANIREVLRLLTETPAKLDTLSKGLSDKELQRPLGEGERSIVETMAHIINCEALSAHSIYLALLRDEPLVTDLHPERDLGKLLQVEQLPFSDLLAYFKFRRTILLHVLESLTEKQWLRSITEGKKQRQESVYRQARAQALHELEHVLDLEKKLK